MQVTYLIVTKKPPTFALHVSHTHVVGGNPSDSSMLLPTVRIAVDLDYSVTSVLYADDLFGGRLVEPDEFTTFQECRGGVVVINATNFELDHDELRQVRKIIQRKVRHNTKRSFKKKKSSQELRTDDTKTRKANQAKANQAKANQAKANQAKGFKPLKSSNKSKKPTTQANKIVDK